LRIRQDLIEIGFEFYLGIRVRWELYLSIECDDRPECAFFRQYTQFTLGVDAHHLFLHVNDLLLVDGLQILLREAFKGSLADECPDGLAIVEYTIGLLVLLSHVEIQFDHRHHQLIDNPPDHQGQ
jgi:hypothetical protein